MSVSRIWFGLFICATVRSVASLALRTTILMRGSSGGAPPKKYTKSNLPVKDCIVCGRPMEWRKKWEKNWEEVKYCSERCRRSRSSATGKEEVSTVKSDGGIFTAGEARRGVVAGSTGSAGQTFIGSSRSVGKAISLRRLTNDFDGPSSFSGRPMSPLETASGKRSLSSVSRIIGTMSAAYLGMTIPASQIGSPVSKDVNGRFMQPPNANAASHTLRPTKKELEEVFQGEYWDDLEDVLRKSSFRRLDEAPDDKFYVAPRFVEHIDEPAVKALTAFHQRELRQLAAELSINSLATDILSVPVQVDGSSTVVPNSKAVSASAKELDILDLCSSWTSHLPAGDYPPLAPTAAATATVTSGSEAITTSGISSISGGSRSSSAVRVAGLGMNAEELTSNKQLTEWAVQDLNTNPTLPYATSSFDAILLQLSIDYLTRPVDVLAEACRVLRPGGAIYISFSNRVFIDKAIAGWTGKSDIEHIQTVGNYLHYANTLPVAQSEFGDDENKQRIGDDDQRRWRWKEPFQAINISPSRDSDPLYVVTARRAY